MGSIIDITTLSDKIKIPSLPLPFSGLTDVDIITVPASDGYDDAIVLLANIDFAKLLDIETEITRTDTECDKSNAQSFLPKGADYIIGINKSIYGQISESSRISAKEAIAKEIEYLTKEIKNIELQKEKEKEKFLKEKLKDKKEELKTEKKHLERIKIKKASTSTSKDTLKITIHGKYDIPKTDQLDLSFKVIVSIKFSIEKNGLLHAQCDVETKYNNNAWYTVLGSALGAVVWGPIGWIVGLHTNSIFKKATSEIRSEMSEKVKLMVLSPQDYHYCSQDGVIKLHLQNGIINKLNCILREPIALKQLFDAFFYTAQFAITLKTTSVFFDDNGATIWGRFNRLEEHLICEDVILKQIKYYNDGRTPTLVYKKITIKNKKS